MWRLAYHEGCRTWPAFSLSNLVIGPLGNFLIYCFLSGYTLGSVFLYLFYFLSFKTLFLPVFLNYVLYFLTGSTLWIFFFFSIVCCFGYYSWETSLKKSSDKLLFSYVCYELIITPEDYFSFLSYNLVFFLILALTFLASFF